MAAPAAAVPAAAEPSNAAATVQLASQWRLIWWRFRKHKLALASGVVVVLVYLVAAFVEFLAPFSTDRMISKLAYAPPQRLRFVEQTDTGTRYGLYVYGYTAASTGGAGGRDPLLEIKGLMTHFFTDEGVVKAVDGADFAIARGKTVCVVGESAAASRSRRAPSCKSSTGRGASWRARSCCTGREARWWTWPPCRPPARRFARCAARTGRMPT